MAKPFTNGFITSLKAEQKRRDYLDAGNRGFGIRVETSGRKTWFYFYWTDGRKDNGDIVRKKKRINIGTYPDMSLTNARSEYYDLKKNLVQGILPGDEKRLNELEKKQETTVNNLIEEYLQVIEGRTVVAEKITGESTKKVIKKKRFGKLKSADQVRRSLLKEVKPLWGNRRVCDIEKEDVEDLVDNIGERPAPVSANRTLSHVSTLFNFGMSKNRAIKYNPCIGVDKYEEESRERVLTKSEINQFWIGLRKCKMTKCIQLALKLQLVTCQRKGEVVTAERSEIDLSENIWTIPGEKAKNGLAQRVPLSGLAIEIIEEALNLKEKSNWQSKWLFPSPAYALKDAPVRPSSVNHALRDNLETLELENIRPHDLRRTGSTEMASMGISEETVEKVLNHKKGGVTKVYVRYSYDKEKKYALDAWASKLTEIIENKD